MKLSREAATATLIIYLAKSPRLEEIIDALVKNIAIDYRRILLERDVRSGFIRLLSIGSIVELDENIFNVYRSEFDYIRSILPEEYSHYTSTFLEIYDFEKLLAAFSDSRKMHESVHSYTNTLENPQYRACYRSGSYRCLLEVYIDRIVSMYRKIYRAYLEEYIDALKAVVIFTSARYFMHLKNSHILELAEYSYSEFIKSITQKLNLFNQMPDYKLYTVLENIGKLATKEYLDVLEIYEAAYVYSTVKTLLYTSYQLIDQLTLYLINRYYEQRMLRYTHPLMSIARERYRVR